MKKYFLFRKEEVSITSSTLDDTGDTVSVFAVPADSLAFVSSEVGKVIFVFNDATIYEESNLTDGESMKKASIEVECEEGGEFDLVEQVLGFLSREDQPGRNIMKFDAVGVSTFNSKTPVVKSPKKPIKRITQEPSVQTFVGSSDAFTVSTATSIEGVEFEDASNLPLVDYNATATDFNGFSDNAEITAWKNSTKATGGTAYDITSNAGTPKIAFADTNFSQKYVSGQGSGSGAADYFVVPEINISGDYTIYLVMLLGSSSGNAATLFADEEGDCFGPMIFEDTAKFQMRHDVAGSAVIASPPDPDIWPADKLTRVGGASTKTVYPLVIRRDKQFNMFFYTKDGLFAYIPSTIDPDADFSVPEYANLSPGYSSSKNARTDGDLKITRLGDGSVGDVFSKSAFARFGVVDKDLGDTLCRAMALDLYNKYKP